MRRYDAWLSVGFGCQVRSLIMMFKDFLLNDIYKLPDVDVVEYSSLNQLVIELDFTRSNSLIVDATHAKSHYHHKQSQEVLRERSKTLRKTIYQHFENNKAEFSSQS